MSKTSRLEEIDQLVYRLHGLTEEEIAIDEGKPVNDADVIEATASEVHVALQDNNSEPQLGDCSLYKCYSCGKVMSGFMKDGHVRDAHSGREVEWKKIGG